MCRAMLPLEAPREDASLSPLSSGGLWLPWLVAASLPFLLPGHTAASSSVSNLPPCSLRTTHVVGFRAESHNSGRVHLKALNLITSAKTHFPNKIILLDSRDLMWISFGRSFFALCEKNVNSLV